MTGKQPFAKERNKIAKLRLTDSKAPHICRSTEAVLTLKR
jgi:hypothetical protein